MTVAELISRLQQCRPTDVVIIGYEGVQHSTVVDVEQGWRAMRWFDAHGYDGCENTRESRFSLLSPPTRADAKTYNLNAVVLRMGED